jgi:uncharacterized protein
VTATLTIAVVAKECIPGRVKTRLTPPLAPVEAARLAAASLADTIAAVAAMPASRRVLFFDGTPPSDVAAQGFDVIAQPVGTLDERLGGLLDHVDGPLLLVGMDTPQLTPERLAGPLETWRTAVDAWFGPAADGGFWALALREPDGDLVRGVPMSRPDTGAQQLARLVARGLSVEMLDELRDVDDHDDARAVAAESPATRFAAQWRQLAETRRAS